jgi:hypothetical protein
MKTLARIVPPTGCRPLDRTIINRKAAEVNDLSLLASLKNRY